MSSTLILLMSPKFNVDPWIASYPCIAYLLISLIATTS